MLNIGLQFTIIAATTTVFLLIFIYINNRLDGEDQK